MIVIKKVGGGVSLMTLVKGADSQEAVAKWKTAHPNEYVSHREMPESARPTDRRFRKAWTDTSPGLTIDLDMTRMNN